MMSAVSATKLKPSLISHSASKRILVYCLGTSYQPLLQMVSGHNAVDIKWDSIVNKGSLSCSCERASQCCVNIFPTRCNYTQFILPVNCSACFGWFLHPSSGAEITVSTASGTGQPLLLPADIVEELRTRLNSSTIVTGSNNV